MSNQSNTAFSPCIAPALDWNFQRQAEKENELLHELSTLLKSVGVLASDSEIVAEELLKVITEIAAPERVSHLIGYIVASSSSDVTGARIKKRGSILLSLDQLFHTLRSGLPVSSSLIEPIKPWTLIAATIAFWSSIRGITSVKASDCDIGAFWALWNLSDAAGAVNKPLQEILLATNIRLIESGKNEIGLADLQTALDHLETIKIVKPSKRGGLYIVKWVRVKYI
jgi:hypothetical protein